MNEYSETEVEEAQTKVALHRAGVATLEPHALSFFETLLQCATCHRDDSTTQTNPE